MKTGWSLFHGPFRSRNSCRRELVGSPQNSSGKCTRICIYPIYLPKNVLDLAFFLNVDCFRSSTLLPDWPGVPDEIQGHFCFSLNNSTKKPQTKCFLNYILIWCILKIKYQNFNSNNQLNKSIASICHSFVHSFLKDIDKDCSNETLTSESPIFGNCLLSLCSWTIDFGCIISFPEALLKTFLVNRRQTAICLFCSKI